MKEGTKKPKTPVSNPGFDRWADSRPIVARVHFPDTLVLFRAVAGHLLLHRCPRCSAWNTTSQLHKVLYSPSGKVTVEPELVHTCGVSYTVQNGEGTIHDATDR